MYIILCRNKKNKIMANQTWVLDPTHSELQFKIKHLMISTVSGQFSRFKATVTTAGDDFSTAAVRFEADVDSISTNNEQRDAHLKNGDFFDTGKYPVITFESSRMVRAGDDSFKLHGTLTMRGISKEVVLNADFGGITTDPWGNTRTGFSVSGKINRFDFGMSFGAVTETGGLLLGDEVKILAEVQFVKETVAQEAALV